MEKQSKEIEYTYVFFLGWICSRSRQKGIHSSWGSWKRCCCSWCGKKGCGKNLLEYFFCLLTASLWWTLRFDEIFFSIFQAKLQDERTVQKICVLDNHVMMAFAGLTADARIIIKRARQVCRIMSVWLLNLFQTVIVIWENQTNFDDSWNRKFT